VAQCPSSRFCPVIRREWFGSAARRPRIFDCLPGTLQVSLRCGHASAASKCVSLSVQFFEPTDPKCQTTSSAKPRYKAPSHLRIHRRRCP